MQIVPASPSAADGLAGYAAALTPRLASLLDGEVRFLIGDPTGPHPPGPPLPPPFSPFPGEGGIPPGGWGRPSPGEGGRGGGRGDGGEGRWAGADGTMSPRTVPVAARSAEALLSALRAWRADRPDRPCAVVLQYAGYGYQSRGCPRWLVDGLAAWRRLAPECRLVTFFHEVYASGPPWRSSFWLSPVQRRLATRLAEMSDGTATSLDLYAALLGRLCPRAKPAAVLPVVSNVGEPAAVPPLASRSRRLIVFGGAGNRTRIYAHHLADLAAACRAAGALEIADIGPPVALPPAVEEIPVVRLGLLPAAEVSAALLGAVAGFLAYPAAFLSKSGAFAAFCAHGLATVCTSAAPPTGGLRAGEHYLPLASVHGRGPGDLQATAGAARAWYAGHSLDRHAATLRELLCA
jgi:hypothetical protein